MKRAAAQAANTETEAGAVIFEAGGLFDLWEVRLFPQPGVSSPPLSVVVPARDSRGAVFEAMKRYPGYVAGPAVKARRRGL